MRSTDAERRRLAVRANAVCGARGLRDSRLRYRLAAGYRPPCLLGYFSTQTPPMPSPFGFVLRLPT